jgi:hypothetical protein
VFSFLFSFCLDGASLLHPLLYLSYPGQLETPQKEISPGRVGRSAGRDWNNEAA